jgi:uncharacterized protein YjbJ (UPF0337 family)
MTEREADGSGERIVVRPGESRVVEAHRPAEVVPGRWRATGHEPADRAVDRIESEIGATRAELGETIDAIQERLSPDHVGEQVQRVAEQVKEQVRGSVQELAAEAKDAIRGATIGRVESMIADARDTAVDVRDGFFDRVRANPVPAAIAGLGLAWLFMSDSGRSRRGGYRDRRGARYHYRPEARDDLVGYEARYVERYPASARGADDVVGQAREAVGNAAGHAREAVGSAAGQARESVASAAEAARDRAEWIAREAQERVDDVAGEAERRARLARDRFEDVLGASPLALGALAVGLGMAVGLAVPSTEREDELLGETRDQLLARARDVVGEVAEGVREQANEVLGATEGAGSPAGGRDPGRPTV